GIAGITVKVVSGGLTVATRVTDSSGHWQVKGLSAGTGEVDVVVPPLYTQTAPSTVNYAGTLTAGQSSINLNFGLHSLGPAPVSEPGLKKQSEFSDSLV